MTCRKDFIGLSNCKNIVKKGNENMKIIQIIPTIAYGDAVGNDSLAVMRVIKEMGYKTGIYAENIDDKLHEADVYRISDLPKLQNDDIIIFNHSTGTDLCYNLSKIPGRKMMIYHNITPPKYFKNYNKTAEGLCAYGYEGTRYLSDKIEYAMADSRYNANDLKKMGYECPVFIRPILIPFDDYKKTPDKTIIKQYSNDGYLNIVFVGRIAPNKKYEDVIAAYAYYKKHINPRSRLILVGSSANMELYCDYLKDYVKALNLEDVIFTGHVKFNAILAYYRIADVFLCMSEHEGFCVPLVEAMFFKVPIIAYNSSAIEETLGGSGFLTDTTNPVFIAKLIDRIVIDKNLRDSIIKKQDQRLECFSYENIRSKLVEGLTGFIDKIY